MFLLLLLFLSLLTVKVTCNEDDYQHIFCYPYSSIHEVNTVDILLSYTYNWNNDVCVGEICTSDYIRFHEMKECVI